MPWSFFLKTVMRPAIALALAGLVLTAGVFCYFSAHAASISIKGGRESGEQAIDTFIREDNERIQNRLAEQNAAWGAVAHFPVDCPNLIFPAEAYCRSGECSGFSGAARELCERGPVAMYDHEYKNTLEYIAAFVDHASCDLKRFGKNEIAALRVMNMSRQARLEFSVYHLSGLTIHIWGDEPIRMFNP